MTTVNQRQQSANSERITLAAARGYCRQLASQHRFQGTVASLLIPRPLMMHYHAIIAFYHLSNMLVTAAEDSRTALHMLRSWREELNAAYAGRANHPITIALTETIHTFDIPMQPFLALLFAREQDLLVKRYRTYDQLRRYCGFAAAPLGELALRLFRANSANQRAAMDRIATGLYLTSRWCNIPGDWQVGRSYLPEEDCNHFGYAAADWAERRQTPALEALMQFEVDRTRELLYRGLPIVDLLPSELGTIIELAVATALESLNDLERSRFKIWRREFRLGWLGKSRVLWRAARAQRYRGQSA